MNIIITMAGMGQRFYDAGYDKPKFMLEAHGKSLFELSMLSLTDFYDKAENWVFIVREECKAVDFIKSECKKLGIEKMAIIELDYLTDGQATTCLLGLEKCEDDKEIVIYNIDTYVKEGTMKYADIKGDGFIPCFNAPGEHWSFVKTDENNKAIEIAEKRKISDNCTLGLYYFSSAKLYKELYETYYSKVENLVNGEKYIAPLYNYMVKINLDVYISNIDKKDVFVLGTPKEYTDYLESARDTNV